MSINNMELIEPLLNFENKGDFYMLYIFKRKKDQSENEKQNHQSVRTIKTYCIESIDYLQKKWEEIVTLSELFKARVYIHIQKQNHNDVGLQMNRELAERLINGVTNHKDLFESVVGQLRTHEKRWIIDIDTKNEKYTARVITLMADCQPILYNEDGTIDHKVIEMIPTKSGYHLIAKPFNVAEFQKKFYELFDKLTPMPEIQKKNPTLLYYPNSLDDENIKFN